jgi:purine catabolism regulator
MSITVSELFKLKSFQNAKLVSGAGGLSNSIEQVSFIETPDANLWFKGRELFISAFYSIKNDPEAQLEILKSMKKMGSAGLVICYRERYVKEIAPEVITYSNENNLPIIELSDMSVLYYDLINEITYKIVYKKTRLLEYAREIHNNMTSLIINGKSYLEIGLSMEELVGFPLAFTCGKENTLYLSRKIDAKIFNAILKYKDSDEIDKGKIKFLDSYFFRLKVPDCPSTVVIIPIIISNKAFIDIIVLEQGRELDEWEIIALREGAVAIALEHAQKTATKEVEQRLLKEFLDDLITGQILPDIEVIERGYLYGIDLKLYSVLMIIEINKLRQFYDIKSDQFTVRSLIEKLRKIVENVVSSRYDKSLVFDRSNGIVIMPHFGKVKNPQEEVIKARSLADKILETLKAEIPKLNFLVGMSDYFDNPVKIHKAYSEALEAVKVSRRLINRGLINKKINLYTEIEAYSVLNQLIKKGDLINYYEKAYKPLMEYDRQNNTELAKTMEAYFISYGSSVEAAKKLFVHRNSIKYRKAKIIEILGIDPFNGPAYTKFFLATIIRQLITQVNDDANF